MIKNAAALPRKLKELDLREPFYANDLQFVKAHAQMY